MEGEAIASRVLELGPGGAKFLGPVILEGHGHVVAALLGEDHRK